MDQNSSRLTYLFNAYFDKRATDSEKEELFELIRLSKNDDQLNSLMNKAWQNPGQLQEAFFQELKSEELLSNILQKYQQAADKNISKFKVVNHPIIRLIAAVLIITISIGAFFLIRYNYKSKETVTKLHPADNVLPGGNKAVLKLANGKTIILDNARIGTVMKVGQTQINKAEDGLLVYNFDKSNSTNKSSAVFNTITTPRGGQYQIILPDGSKAWLNAASSLRFPTQFSGNFREVEITGEVYFEVAKNAALPFKVRTKNEEIQVIGTHFNLMAYDDERAMKTTLIEGIIKLKSKSATNILKPGEQATVDANGFQTIAQNVETDDVISWTNGMFQFKDAGIEEIMRQVARWYDVDVSFEGKIPVKQLTGQVSRNVKASVMLDMLSYSGINFEINGKNILVKN